MASASHRCMWLRPLIVVCGFGLSPLYVASASHRCMWLRPLTVVCGFGLSPLYVASASHRCMWLRPLTVVCGFGLSPLSYLVVLVLCVKETWGPASVGAQSYRILRIALLSISHHELNSCLQTPVVHLRF